MRRRKNWEQSQTSKQLLALWCLGPFFKPKKTETIRIKEKRMTEVKVSPVLVRPTPPPRVIGMSPKCGMTYNNLSHHTLSKAVVSRTEHTTEVQMSHVWARALSYQCSPFCSSVAYNQGGSGIQTHPACSHNCAHSLHCSHCIHLCLKGERGGGNMVTMRHYIYISSLSTNKKILIP